MVGSWTLWSAPSESGISFRKRYIINKPVYGGKPCPALYESKKGKSVALHKNENFKYNRLV